ncbi:MAG TPA: polyketide synthase dehydratase domain-containing protein, partial [Candidatus Angelobacter sp.]|nr:polyketide synthase dehydratase domain-containing protein [Candidatus Angelobacter sp.]
VAVRCSATSFLVDHFSADCVFGESATETQAISSERVPKALPLDPISDLYGRILFHQGRFQRITAYHELQAKKCVCAVSGSKNQWFGRYLPGEMILGDAAPRDAAIHCIQACIPHKTVLPAGVEAVEIYRSWTSETAIVRAQETWQNEDDFIYDVTVEDTSGALCEEWKGLRLHAVAALKTNAPWNCALLVPYLERRLADLLPHADLKIALAAISNGYQDEGITHRPDGKPEDPSAPQVEISRSHASGLCLTVRSKCALGCDLEECIEAEEKNWKYLLGVDGFRLAEVIAGRHAISLSLAATQIWALKESLRKSGAPLNHLLQIERHFPDGWTLLSSGSVRAAIFQTHIQGFQTQFAFGFASRQAR